MVFRCRPGERKAFRRKRVGNALLQFGLCIPKGKRRGRIREVTKVRRKK